MGLLTNFEFSYSNAATNNDALIYRNLIEKLTFEKTRAGLKKILTLDEIDLVQRLWEGIIVSEQQCNMSIKTDKDKKPNINIAVYQSDYVQTSDMSGDTDRK